VPPFEVWSHLWICIVLQKSSKGGIISESIGTGNWNLGFIDMQISQQWDLADVYKAYCVTVFKVLWLNIDKVSVVLHLNLWASRFFFPALLYWRDCTLFFIENTARFSFLNVLHETKWTWTSARAEIFGTSATRPAFWAQLHSIIRWPIGLTYCYS
jgi:hypothetical protein